MKILLWVPYCHLTFAWCDCIDYVSSSPLLSLLASSSYCSTVLCWLSFHGVPKSEAHLLNVCWPAHHSECCCWWMVPLWSAAQISVLWWWGPFWQPRVYLYYYITFFWMNTEMETQNWKMISEIPQTLKCICGPLGILRPHPTSTPNWRTLAYSTRSRIQPVPKHRARSLCSGGGLAQPVGPLVFYLCLAS